MAYADTNHLFSQPIRTYKANDPYYYEVDNIPIRQLEENVLWAKDQLDSLLSPPSGDPQTGSPLFVGDDIDLEHIKQMRPKFMGARNIKVQPGRFTARVNDAYEVRDSLAQIAVRYLGGCSDLPSLSTLDTTAFFDAVWASYTTKLTTESFVSCPGESNEAAAYRANGLETMFTFYLSRSFGHAIPNATTTTYGAPEYLGDGTGRGKTWPALWHANIASLAVGAISPTDWSKLNELHMKVVQHWRGVIRTSVVDFRGETFSIPPFDRYDYFYTEEVAGEEVIVSLEDLATQRIDLLVVYTHPIDSSGTDLTEYAPGVSPIATGGTPPAAPKTILEPRLGLIRGAGIGIKRAAADKIELLDKRMYPGEQKILANLNDHTDGGSNTGIRLSNGAIVKGSFPSPDDLANIAPNLSLSLGDDNLQLVGQTALPIAYVVVTKGSNTLTQDDIIDIRPFLRTTELAYNERAGIAGAQPALSFANPAVGAAQLDSVAKCLQDQIGGITIPTPAAAPTTGVTHVHQDYIMGGLAYGPEGSFLMMHTTTQPLVGLGEVNGVSMDGLYNWWKNRTVEQKRKWIKGIYDGQTALGGAFTVSEWMADPNSSDGRYGNYLGLPEDRVIPLLPEWQAQINPDTTDSDANKWYSGGIKYNDFVCKSQNDGNISNGHFFGSMFAYEGEDIDTAAESHQYFFLRKPIRVVLPAGASNFSMTAQYEGCIPFIAQYIEAAGQGVVGTNNQGVGFTGYEAGRYEVGGGIDGPIAICKTGSYADPATGEQVVDLLVIVTYPLQNLAPVYTGGGAPPTGGLTNFSNGRLPYRTFAAAEPIGQGAGPNLFFEYTPPGTEVPGTNANFQRNGAENVVPMFKTGYSYYPTVSLTLSFHGAGNVAGQLMPQSAIDQIDTDPNSTYWTTGNHYPPTYYQKVIDLR